MRAFEVALEQVQTGANYREDKEVDEQLGPGF
jgi:hypothetical protein